MSFISGYEIRCFILFFQIFGDLNKTIYICQTIFEANHNKDYSVVKTFRGGDVGLSLFFIYNGNCVCESTYRTFSGGAHGYVMMVGRLIHSLLIV